MCYIFFFINAFVCNFYVLSEVLAFSFESRISYITIKLDESRCTSLIFTLSKNVTIRIKSNVEV